MGRVVIPMGSYCTICPKCGARLFGFTKEDYVDHLEQNGERLAARIVDEMVVDEAALVASPKEDEDER